MTHASRGPPTYPFPSSQNTKRQLRLPYSLLVLSDSRPIFVNQYSSQNLVVSKIWKSQIQQFYYKLVQIKMYLSIFMNNLIERFYQAFRNAAQAYFFGLARSLQNYNIKLLSNILENVAYPLLVLVQCNGTN